MIRLIYPVWRIDSAGTKPRRNVAQPDGTTPLPGDACSSAGSMALLNAVPRETFVNVDDGNLFVPLPRLTLFHVKLVLVAVDAHDALPLSVSRETANPNCRTCGVPRETPRPPKRAAIRGD